MSLSASDAGALLVFTATYNEALNITSWYERVRRVYPEAHVLIIDDNSPDGTAAIVQDLAARDRNLTLVVRPGKLGLGSAHKSAFAYAWEGGYQALATLDADLSHEPEQLPDLVAKLGPYDFVIGTRWGDGTCDYRGVRRFVSWAANSSARQLLRTPVTEYTTSMRAFSRAALQTLITASPHDDGYAFFMEVVVQLSRAGHRLTEVPIRFHDRTHGKSKIPRGQIAISSYRLLTLAARRR